MIHINKLNQLLKTKRKQPKPQYLIKITDQITQSQQQIHITINQKGIIIELLSRICHNQFKIFYEYIRDYYQSLQGFGKQKRSTVRKKRERGQRGNTTTAKKKQGRPEQLRAQNNIEQMLDKELSTPNNTQMGLLELSNTQRKKIQFQLNIATKIEISSQIQQQFITPLKQIQNAQQNLSNFDQYRAIIQPISKLKPKPSTKNQQTTKTRKKPHQTQKLLQQINNNISLTFSTQLSLKHELQNILQSTKKKKKIQKQSYIDHILFQQFPHQNQFDFGNKEAIKEFCKGKFSGVLRGNYQGGYSQRSGFVSGGFGEGFWEGQELVCDRRCYQAFDEVDKLLKHKQQVEFNHISQKINVNTEQKSILFYNLLCNDKYTLTQQSPKSFGKILISISNNNQFF